MSFCIRRCSRSVRSPRATNPKPIRSIPDVPIRWRCPFHRQNCFLRKIKMLYRHFVTTRVNAWLSEVCIVRAPFCTFRRQAHRVDSGFRAQRHFGIEAQQSDVIVGCTDFVSTVFDHFRNFKIDVLCFIGGTQVVFHESYDDISLFDAIRIIVRNLSKVTLKSII